MLGLGWLFGDLWTVLLQKVLSDREKHEVIRLAYEEKVKVIEEWLVTAKVTGAGEPMATMEVQELEEELERNQVF